MPIELTDRELWLLIAGLTLLIEAGKKLTDVEFFDQSVAASIREHEQLLRELNRLYGEVQTLYSVTVTITKGE